MNIEDEIESTLRRLVERHHAAQTAKSVGQWLFDDVEKYRNAANKALHSCVRAGTAQVGAFDAYKGTVRFVERLFEDARGEDNVRPIRPLTR